MEASSIEKIEILLVSIPAIATISAPIVTWILKNISKSAYSKKLIAINENILFYENLITKTKINTSIDKLDALKEREVTEAIGYFEKKLSSSQLKTMDVKSYESDIRHRLLLFIPKQASNIAQHILFYGFVLASILSLLLAGAPFNYIASFFYAIVALGMQQIVTRGLKASKSKYWLVVEILAYSLFSMLVTSVFGSIFHYSQAIVLFELCIISFIFGYVVVSSRPYSFNKKLLYLFIISVIIFFIALVVNNIIADLLHLGFNQGNKMVTN